MMNVSFDKEGFLNELSAWSPDVARAIAEQEEIELSPTHWQIIETLQEFYQATDVAPAMRAFVKLVRTEMGDELGNSIALMKLFGESPAKMAAKIAGLPRPTNCL